jgi:membrane protease YdiL (CAAX protease family)
MDNSTDKKPLVQKSWLRVLLFVLFYFFVSLLISVPVILFFTNVKASDFQTDMVRTMSTLGSDYLWLVVLLEFLCSIICVFVFRKFVDRKTFASLGFSTAGHSHEMIAGFFLAPALIGIGSLILYFTKHLEWDLNTFNGQAFFIEAGTLALIAISEELVFRGYILNNLMQSFNKWPALIISSALFTIFHLSNPGISAIPLATLFIGGILFGINYIYTKNLWFSMLLHFSWNLFQGPIAGYKVSGINFSSLLQTDLKGDISITGGDFGFEGSFIATALLLFTVLGFYFIYERKFGKVQS